MSKFKIVRVNNLPTTYTPSTMYILKKSESGFAEVYYTNNDGTALVPGITEQFITDKFVSLLASGLGQVNIVETIEDRNSISKNGNCLIMVIDSRGDEYGSNGTVLYLYHSATLKYYRISVFNSYGDGSQTGSGGASNWEELLGRPLSAPAQIDEAVNMAHSHDNKSSLDRIGVTSDGILTVDGRVFANIVMLDGDW